jgi:hypothetical protein
VEPAEDLTRRITAEEVVSAGGDSHDVGGGGRAAEVGEYTMRRVAVPRQVYEVGAERPREL